jgi:uncharacterized repeat protein (TIGR01451 family)
MFASNHQKAGNFGAALRLLSILVLMLGVMNVLPVSGAAPNTSQYAPQQVAPILTITKTADKAAINTGEPMGFTIIVTNTGSAVATTVVVTDSLPGNSLLTWKISPAVTGCSISRRVLKCTWSQLAVGGSYSVHLVSGNVPNQCAVYSNTATVTASNHPAVSATATVNALCADLVVSVVAVNSPIYNGQDAIFIVTVVNTGQVLAKTVRLINTLPTVVSWKASTTLCKKFLSDFLCNFGNLAPGASVTVTFRSTIPTTGCGSLQDDAIVSASNEPVGSAGNRALAVVDIYCPELTLNVTADAPNVTAGNPIGYTIGVENLGPGASYQLALTDTLPAASGLAWTLSPAVTGCALNSNVLSCSMNQLDGGASFSVHITSPTTIDSCGAYTNTAELKDQFETPISASADIVVSCP